MELKVIFLATVLGLAFAGPESDFEKLIDVDSKFYTPPKPNSTDSVPRIARQTPGTTAVCTPMGTCISLSGNVIDPRVVVGGPLTCPAGQVACTGLASAAACGLRHVANVGTADGPAPYGAFPWQAFIRTTTGFTASGVLIDSNHVLTAAHKIYNIPGLPGSLQVHMGVHNPTNLAQAQNRTVRTIVYHPNFNSNSLFNDIVVLRLSSPVALGYQNNIGTACLPTSVTSFVNQRCTVSGWGDSSFGAINAAIAAQKQVTVPIVSYDTCRTSMLQPTVLGTNTDYYLDKNGELCAGGEFGKDACTQDGGSPLVCRDPLGRFSVAGLVIWGKNCGQTGVYGVYVDVAKYRTWIDQTITSLNSMAG